MFLNGVFELLMQKNGQKNAMKQSAKNAIKQSKENSFFSQLFWQKAFDMGFPRFFSWCFCTPLSEKRPKAPYKKVNII
jgi:hypothetical protein